MRKWLPGDSMAKLKSNHSYIQVNICLFKKKQQRIVESPVQPHCCFPSKQEGQLVIKEGFCSLLPETVAGLFSHYCFKHQHKFRNGLILNHTSSSLQYIQFTLFCTQLFLRHRSAACTATWFSFFPKKSVIEHFDCS